MFLGGDEVGQMITCMGLLSCERWDELTYCLQLISVETYSEHAACYPTKHVVDYDVPS